MPTSTKRTMLGRGKGYLNAAGPQSRFIIFLIFVLIAYTMLLQVFQKLAAILQLPLFFSISLLTLLVFVGVVGTVYSHSFVGPIARIRRTIDHLAEGDTTIALKLRDSDDPMLKDLVEAIGRLSEHNRNTHSLVIASAKELIADVQALEQAVRSGLDKPELERRVGALRSKHEMLQKAVQSLGKA